MIYKLKKAENPYIQRAEASKGLAIWCFKTSLQKPMDHIPNKSIFTELACVKAARTRHIQQPLHLEKHNAIWKWCPDLKVLIQLSSHSTFWSSDFLGNIHTLAGLYSGWGTCLTHLLLLSSAVNISRRHNHGLAACYTKECLETCLRAHSGIAEGPAVPQCKSLLHIGSSFVVISSDTVRQVHLEISEKPGQKAFQEPESAILA